MKLPDGDRDGQTYKVNRDRSRLNTQAADVFDLMCDGQWRSLKKISEITGHPETSIGARLRDFRKVRFGAYIVGRRYISNGVFEYKLETNENQT